MRKLTRHEKILELLIVCYPAKLPMQAFQNAKIGGSAGGVRLRELRRDKGVDIYWERVEEKRHIPNSMEGKTVAVYKYRLSEDHVKILKSFGWEYILRNKSWTMKEILKDYLEIE